MYAWTYDLVCLYTKWLNSDANFKADYYISVDIFTFCITEHLLHQ